MGQTVYVDLLFLINFSMDFLCFFLTAKLLNRRLPVFRALAASAAGGIYSDAVLFINVGRIASLAIDIAVCAAMCAIVFLSRKEIRSLPLCTLVYLAVSMALGGFMTALFNLLNSSGLTVSDGDSASDGISVWMFAFLAAAAGIMTLLGGKFFRRKTCEKSAEVEITYGGKKVKLRAMTDSGNLLREPISGRPCIVADVSSVGSIIPPEVVRAVKSKDISAIETFAPQTARNIRIVPARTASGDGMLIALKAEQITVGCGGKNHNVDALIALSEIDASAGGSEALLPCELLV